MLDQASTGLFFLPPVNTLKSFRPNLPTNTAIETDYQINCGDNEYSIMLFTVNTKDFMDENYELAKDTPDNPVRLSPSDVNLVQEPNSQQLVLNQRQYYRIMKRRQDRAILEKKYHIPKNRSRYLHESRHRHAVNRARGKGGRFESKKDDDKDFLDLFDIHLYEQ